MAVERTTISAAELNLLFYLTLAGLILRGVNLLASTVFAPPSDGTDFGIYSIFEMKNKMSPLYSFIVFLICTPLAWKIDKPRLLVSLFPISLLAIFFDWWLIDSRLMIADAYLHAGGEGIIPHNPLLLGGSHYDVATLFLVNILLVWQVTILWRLRSR